MRPQEWVKNTLVFAGLLFSGKFDEGAAVADATLAFVAFCADLECGLPLQRPPRRRARPAPPREAKPARSRAARWRPAPPAIAAVLLAIGAIALPLATVDAEVAGLVAVYGVTTVAYSLILKRLVIIDVMTIAFLFIVRVVAGAVAVEAQASEYLLVCTGMLALFMGFTKRRQEAILEGTRHGRDATRRSSTTRSRSSTRWSRWSPPRRSSPT